MRMRLALALAFAVVLAPAGQALAQGEQPRVVEAGNARFPERSFVLRVPGRQPIVPETVRVVENGDPVGNLRVESAREEGGADLGVVLVIDASRSMRGRPIEGAMDAARAFAERRSPSQPLAVIAFNSRAHVVLPFTTNRGRIKRALAEPPVLGRETRINDATAAALRMLERARISAGSVIVLSDGADIGSRLQAPAVARASRDSGARLFTVGLESGSFDASTLRELAFRSGGRYASAASPGALARIYDSLGAQLASEYFVSYRSFQRPGRDVKVSVTFDGLKAALVSGYQSPAGPRPGALAPFERSAADKFWRSPLAIISLSLLGAGAIGLAVAAITRPRTRDLGERLAGFVSMREDEPRRRSLFHGRLADGAERSLARTGWWEGFTEDVEIARMSRSPLSTAGLTAVATVVTAALLSLLVGPLIAVLALMVPLGAHALVARALRKQRLLFTEQLAENLQVMASAMRAGHSLSSAVGVVADEASEPSKREFNRVVADEQLGVPLDEALERVARRMDSRDLDQVGIVATLQRDTGGNTAEVLDRVAETIRARGELRRLVMTLTAQGRLARWIVTFMPVALLAVISVLNPGYVQPLFTTGEGNALLAIAAGMVVLGSLVIRRIVEIKV